MNTLYIDTHRTKIFDIGFYNNKTFTLQSGTDTSLEILEKIEFLTQKKFEKIIICTGPGSLTGLRIGSCLAKGMTLAKNIETYGINIWTLIFNEFQDIEIYFHTGTKKWLYKTKDKEEIMEKLSPPKGIWTSNNSELLSNFDQKTYKKWPNIIELMHKYNELASKNIDLIYQIDLFC